MSKYSVLYELNKCQIPIPSFIFIDKTKIANIDSIIEKLDNNLYYAIRSSANVEDGKHKSFAGLFETYLGIEFSKLKKYILKCFYSCQNDAVKEYCKAYGIKEDIIDMGVIVQKMIISEISGVCFSVNPITGNQEFIIEAVYGLGDGLVSGRYRPDKIIIMDSNVNSYIVSHQKLALGFDSEKIVEYPIPLLMQSMKKLDDGKISNIMKTVVRIREIMGCEIDVEWAFVEDVLYILQARPITALEWRLNEN